MPQDEWTVKPVYEFSKARTAIDVAYSHIYIPLSDNIVGSSAVEEFMDGLRGGVALGISTTSFYNDRCGWGGKFAFNRYSNSMSDLKTTINTYYLGLEFLVRIPAANSSGAWILSLSAGPVFYDEKMEITRYKDSSMFFGFKSTAEIGYDIRLSKNVFLGFKLASNLVIVKVNYQDDLNNASAIEVGGGLRF